MNPSEPRLLRVEVVADLPVLWATLQRLDLPATLDRLFPAPANWKGPLSPGKVLAVWLLFVLSQGDHCLNHVEPWVAQHHGTLSALLGQTVLPVHGQFLRRCSVRARAVAVRPQQGRPRPAPVESRRRRARPFGHALVTAVV